MKKFEFIMVISIFAFVGVEDAHAYIDPGTGSFVMQVVIGCVLASIFTIKTYWLKIKHYIVGLFSCRCTKSGSKSCDTIASVANESELDEDK